MPPLRTLLMCERESLVFPVGGESVEMHFPRNQCCDMKGAIAVAEMCRPGVEEICTYSGGQPDAAFFKSGGRRSLAVAARHQWHSLVARINCSEGR